MKRGDYLKITREKQIKASALKLFSKKGFQNTTVAEIAESAGLSKGLIYWYWDSKEDIAFSLIEEMLTAFLKVIDESKDEKGSFTERYKGLIEGVADVYYQEKTHCLLYRKLVIDNTGEVGEKYDKEIGVVYSKIVNSIADLLQKGIKSGEIKKIDTNFYSLMILGVTEGLEGIWLEYESFNIREALRFVLGSILQSIKKE